MRCEIDGRQYLFQWQHITEPFKIIEYILTNKPIPYAKPHNYGAVTICTVKAKDADGKYQEVLKTHSLARWTDMIKGSAFNAEVVIEKGQEVLKITPGKQKLVFDKDRSRKISLRNALEAMRLVYPDRKKVWQAYRDEYHIKDTLISGVTI